LRSGRVPSVEPCEIVRQTHAGIVDRSNPTVGGSAGTRRLTSKISKLKPATDRSCNVEKRAGSEYCTFSRAARRVREIDARRG
jgi:hypothetical protein